MLPSTETPNCSSNCDRRTRLHASLTSSIRPTGSDVTSFPTRLSQATRRTPQPRAVTLKTPFERSRPARSVGGEAPRRRSVRPRCPRGPAIQRNSRGCVAARPTGRDTTPVALRPDRTPATRFPGLARTDLSPYLVVTAVAGVERVERVVALPLEGVTAQELADEAVVEDVSRHDPLDYIAFVLSGTDGSNTASPSTTTTPRTPTHRLMRSAPNEAPARYSNRFFRCCLQGPGVARPATSEPIWSKQ